MAQPVRLRRLTEQEVQKLQRTARRGTTSTVRFRRAMMLLASAGGNSVPVIARLVQADGDTVRDVIHRFNEIGLACLDPRWAGGRHRLPTPDEEDFVIQTAATRPTKLGKPFTRWSIRNLADHLRCNIARTIRIGREALRLLLARRGITFQRTKTWKESTDPDFDAKLERIEYALNERPDRTFAFDEFGPLGIRPTAGSCWARQGKPDRLPATYHRTHGTRYFHGCYSVGDDTLWGINRLRKGTKPTRGALESIRAARPDGAPIEGRDAVTGPHRGPRRCHHRDRHAMGLTGPAAPRVPTVSWSVHFAYQVRTDAIGVLRFCGTPSTATPPPADPLHPGSDRARMRPAHRSDRNSSRRCADPADPCRPAARLVLSTPDGRLCSALPQL
ncbi:helix-turn-helix domain-containing protein [Streptomyces sp. NPDC053086]|uniref:helix-turn-helix domain-containing protein n=1 Tax=unclassified Streptomyces TaxID=2593676 RepID=UPI0037CD6058